MKLGKSGTVGRFKPLHLGGAVLLEEMCEQADHVIIGIGSSNIYNARNPFTAQETREMIDGFLAENHSNYQIIEIPDLFNAKKWTDLVLDLYGNVYTFVSGNEFVYELVKDHYHTIHPVEIVPAEKQIKLRATQVRIEMAKKGDWEKYVPEAVSDYIKENKLDERFRREFGLETLANLVNQDYENPETVAQEKEHIYGREIKCRR